MKKIFYYTVLASLVAAVSCNKLENGQSSTPSTAKNSIGISKLSVGSYGTKALGNTYENTVSSSDFSLSVTTAIEAMAGTPGTKSAATTTSSLGDFTVDGFLDKEIQEKEGASEGDKSNLHFIAGVPVMKNVDESSASKWVGDFSTPQYWRSGIHHSFWAYTPDINLSVNADNYKKSTILDYSSDFEDDLILASTSNVYYGKDKEPDDTKPSGIDFHFYHALAGISAKDIVSFKSYKSENKTDGLNDDQERGELVRIAARVINKGSCDVEEGEGRVLDFNWTTADGSFGIDNSFSNNNSEPRYVIPQSLENVIFSFVVKDKKRDLTRDDFAFTAAELFGPEAVSLKPDWEAGFWYRYTVKGSFNFPFVGSGQTQPGIDLKFNTKNFAGNYIVQSINTKYTKRLKVTFVGLPVCNSGNGTSAFVSISPVPDTGHLAPVVYAANSYDPVKIDPRDPNSNFQGDVQKWFTNDKKTLKPGTVDRPEIGLIYDYTGQTVRSRTDGTPVGKVTYRDDQGNVLSGPTATGVSFANSICECYFDIDPSWDTITIWASYVGGDNGSTSWALRDCNIEIVEWR